MASLSESYTVLSHGDAIRKALQRGITRDKINCMGNGLAGSLEIAKVNGGSFQVWTGDVTYRMVDGKEKGFVQHATVPGTGLLLSLKTDRPVDLRETFIDQRSFTYIDAEAQRVVDSGGLRILDECAHTGSRPPATGLRRKILALLPQMDSPLLLDFDGVKSASSSFLDELVGRLALELGMENLKAKIRLVNASDRLRGMANVVVKQRLEGYSPTDENIGAFRWWSAINELS